MSQIKVHSVRVSPYLSMSPGVIVEDTLNKTQLEQKKKIVTFHDPMKKQLKISKQSSLKLQSPTKKSQSQSKSKSQSQSQSQSQRQRQSKSNTGHLKIPKKSDILKIDKQNLSPKKSPKKSSKKSLQSILLQHQIRVIDFMKTHRGCLVYHGMGSGKTRIAAVLIPVLRLPAVVVVPASLKDNFKKEIDKINKELKVADQILPSMYQVISMQSFLDNVPDCTGKLLIIDEAHELRNPSGKISQNISQCAKQAEKVLLLTGTPLVNGPRDIAPLLNMIIDGHLNFEVPSTSWFGMKTVQEYNSIPTGKSFTDSFGDNGINSVGKALWKQVLPETFSYYLPPPSPDFPLMQVEDVMVPMKPEQLYVYEAWENRTLTKSMVEMLSGKSISTLNVLLKKVPAFRAYLDGGRRICNVVKVGTKTLAPKMDQVMKHLRSTSGKAIVYSQYLSKGIDVMETLLRKENIPFVKFTGRETESQKQQAVFKYNNDQVRVFLLSSAGGLGLDLHNTESIHILEPHWNQSKISQVIHRGVRFKSHDKPGSVVKVYQYFCYKPRSLLNSLKDILSLKHAQKKSKSFQMSADLYLLQISQQKEKNNKTFLQYAIDNSIENHFM